MCEAVAQEDSMELNDSDMYYITYTNDFILKKQEIQNLECFCICYIAIAFHVNDMNYSNIAVTYWN